MRETQRYKLPVIKYMSHEYAMYSVGNIGNNYLVSLYGDNLISLMLIFPICKMIMRIMTLPYDRLLWNFFSRIIKYFI